MPEGNLARYLAPAALVIAALAVLITWQSSVGDEPPPEPAPHSRATDTTETTAEGGEAQGDGEESRPQQPADDQPKEEGADQDESEGETYTVQSGDSLATIADKTGVDVETLLQLNEDVQPQNLQVGDELQLSP